MWYARNQMLLSQSNQELSLVLSSKKLEQISLIRDGFLWPGRDAPLIVHSLCSVRSVREDCSWSGAWWWHAVSFPTAISLPEPEADTDRDASAAAPAAGGIDDGSHWPSDVQGQETLNWAELPARLVSVHGAWKASIPDPKKTSLIYLVHVLGGYVKLVQSDWPTESHNTPQGPAGYSNSQCFMSAFCIYSPPSTPSGVISFGVKYRVSTRCLTISMF